MNLTTLIELTRIKLTDFVADYYWSDSMLTLFANEATRQACIRADLLYDASNTISVVANTKRYAINPNIYIIESVYADTEGVFLRRASHRDAEVHGFLNSIPGSSTHYILDYEINYLYLNPIPNAADTLTLSAYRLPVEMVIGNDIPEINIRHHIHLVDYMVYAALNTLNPQFGNPDLARLHLDLFTMHFGEEPSASSISMYNKYRPLQRGHPNFAGLNGRNSTVLPSQPMQLPQLPQMPQQ